MQKCVAQFLTISSKILWIRQHGLIKIRYYHVTFNPKTRRSCLIEVCLETFWQTASPSGFKYFRCVCPRKWECDLMSVYHEVFKYLMHVIESCKHCATKVMTNIWTRHIVGVDWSSCQHHVVLRSYLLEVTWAPSTTLESKHDAWAPWTMFHVCLHTQSVNSQCLSERLSMLTNQPAAQNHFKAALYTQH